MSYFARSSSSEIPSSSGNFADTLPAGAGSASGAPSRPVPRAVERSRATGSAGSRPTEMPSRGPAPGTWWSSPAFSSALRTASSSAALFSTSAWASGSSSAESSGFCSLSRAGSVARAAPASEAAVSEGFVSEGRAVSAARALSPHGSSCARTADAAKRAANTMAIAERNPSLLLATERPVKVHIGPCLGSFTDMKGTRWKAETDGGRSLFQRLDELRDRAARQRRLLQLGDMATAGQHRHARALDAREILHAAEWKQAVLRAPEDEHGNVDVREDLEPERTIVPGARVVDDPLHRRSSPVAGEVPRHQPEWPGRLVEEQVGHLRGAGVGILERARQTTHRLVRKLGARRIHADHRLAQIGTLVRRVQRQRAPERVADQHDLAAVLARHLLRAGDHHRPVLSSAERTVHRVRRAPVPRKLQE